MARSPGEVYYSMASPDPDYEIPMTNPSDEESDRDREENENTRKGTVYCKDSKYNKNFCIRDCTSRNVT